MGDLIETLSVENVVGSTALEQELDLESLADDLDGVSYNPDQFPGLVSRTTDPKAASLIFRSGKVVCTGASSTENLTEAVELTFGKLRRLGLEVPDDPAVTIQNIVTSGDLGTRLNLNAIAIGLGLEAVEYEPEQFPGLVYRSDELDVVILLFGSGKLIITAGTQPSDAEDAIRAVQTRLSDLGLLD
ncbi:TATA-box-binding protein [Saliphagus infecundisoli]|uniref:TATA-box-binding protein n=1 Tax=Saliphagus infecundisoli TaxID=1849069 RepID=A0ABD5QC97_9EURY|nr:TATA-box-binding protein [Saliphagus infecundisoli]